MKALVSIIIPTFNRSYLIGETLDSIIAQSYKKWECIVIDDRSLDYTSELMEFYCAKDSRIQFFQRPLERPKGANACRNYGLELSKGKYINWFDSDDLMEIENIESKLSAFSTHIDFVIGNSVNFDEFRNLSRPFKLNYNLKITPENYIGGSIGWITNDVMIRKNCICIKFNESLQFGQEYNFFSRLLYYTQKGEYLKKDLALRRIHNGSIQQNLSIENSKKYNCLFENECFLLDDLKHLANYKIINRSLCRLIRFTYIITPRFKIYKKQLVVFRLLIIHNRILVALFYFVAVISNCCFGKSWKFIKKSNQILIN